MSSDIEIKETTVADTEAVHNVLYHTWKDTYINAEQGVKLKHIHEIIPATMSEEQLRKRQAWITNLPSDHCSFVAKRNGVVVGICAGYRKNDVSKLRSLYVLPQYQGQGIGAMLWRHFKDWAQTQRFIVHVATYNHPAIAFYERQGFVDVGKRFTEERFIFPDGVSIPELEMELVVE